MNPVSNRFDDPLTGPGITVFRFILLGDRVCFRGNVPGSLLCTGTADEVKAYIKELID